jgi:hypothetical protein
MSIEELKRQFIVDDDALKARLEPIVAKALKHCRIDKKGQVLITNQKLSARDQLLFVLIARTIASQLDPSISPDVTVAEISKFTGLPANQIRARGKDVIGARFAEALEPGIYRAIPGKVELFLDNISTSRKTRA